ncbi:MAG TPA: mercury methylation ferredoxin HgcB [Spirochaetia bacterium]|nr:mercury methylation ferredoxin HgcB [Spirochaetales bacterium]HRY79188.1 mercury methylation ferredoxin HgcB [Spirochaetia bacterium]HRZ88473.1 mercury methylation ferredoxin HgcB [Spirochaetia bacterium]
MLDEYLMNGSSLRLDPDACVGCEACVDVCPHGVFLVEEGKARIANRGACMECGACALNCPAAALTVRAGVGCAAAIILGKLRGTAPSCGDGGCSGDRQAGCC